MSDERLGAAWRAALAAVRRGGGIIFRHDHVPDRMALGRGVAALARRRGLAFVVAGAPEAALRLRAQGLHRRESAMRPGWPRLRGGSGGGAAPAGGWRTASAHGVAGLVAARRAGVDLAFVGPLFATASHPGARPLGRVRLGLMLRQARTAALGPAVAALGGMSAARWRRLGVPGLATWGAIDAFAASRARPGG